MRNDVFAQLSSILGGQSKNTLEIHLRIHPGIHAGIHLAIHLGIHLWILLVMRGETLWLRQKPNQRVKLPLPL